MCTIVYRIQKGKDSNKFYETLSKLKNWKLKINNILIEKYKNTNEKPDFERNFHSRSSVGIYMIGYHSVRLMKWMA